MGQVTSRVSDELEASLNRWASEEGMQRSDLIRQVLGEAVQARLEGRATFERAALPGPPDLQRLAAKLDQQSTELDRVLRQNAKRDAELTRQVRDDTLGVSSARDAIVADVVARLRTALELIHGELVKTREELTTTVERLPQIAAVMAKLDRIEVFTQQPRSETVNRIGPEQWAPRWFVAIGATAIMLGAVAFYALGLILPSRWVAVPAANYLLGNGDQAICALVDYRIGYRACRLRVSGRDMRVTIDTSTTTPEPKR